MIKSYFITVACLLQFGCQVISAQVLVVDEATDTVYVDSSIPVSRCNQYNPTTRLCGDGDQFAFSELATAARELRQVKSVLIQPGQYTGGVVVRSGGSESEPLIFKATGPSVVIEGRPDGRDAFFINDTDWVVVDGITIQNANRAGLRISMSDNVTIRNSTFANNGSWGLFTDFSNYTTVENSVTYGAGRQHGIYISNSSDYPIIRNNIIHNNAAAGLHMNGDVSMGGDGIISNAIVENNIIYENGRRGGSAINMDGVTDSLIRNNLLYENHASGISLYRTDGATESHGNQVLNNTIIMARDGRWAMNAQSTENNKLYNNIFFNRNPFRGSILAKSPISPGFESDYNLLTDSFSSDESGVRRIRIDNWQSLGYDVNSMIAQPTDTFVDERGADFRLKPDSLAIDAGTSLDDVESDLNGNPRNSQGSYDIGAIEM